MASPEVAQEAGEKESLWRKSNAFKYGVGFAVVVSIFSPPVALVGLGVAAGSAVWHHEKNPLNKKK